MITKSKKNQETEFEYLIGMPHINLAREAIIGQLEFLKNLQTAVCTFYTLNTMIMNHCILSKDKELLTLFQNYKEAVFALNLAFLSKDPIPAPKEEELLYVLRNEV